jgi:hypothetical protein
LRFGRGVGAVVDEAVAEVAAGDAVAEVAAPGRVVAPGLAVAQGPAIRLAQAM